MPGRVGHLLRNILRRSAVEQALDDELESSVELLIDEGVRAGLTRAEARRRAIIELGGIDQVKEQCREARGGAFLDTLARDLRYSARVLRKAPGFTLAAVLTLALGIGGATAVFSVVNAVLLRPLPYQEPEKLVTLFGVDPKMPEMRLGVAPGSYSEIRRRSGSFTTLAALRPGRKVQIIGAGEATQAAGALATGDFFRLMGVPALLGRTFGPADARPGSAPVAVISHGLWQRAFGGDPGAIGRTIVIDEAAVTILGVMPASFAQPAKCEVWMAFDLDLANSGDFRSGDLTVLGRLSRNVSLMQCNSELKGLHTGRAEGQTGRRVTPELQGKMLEEVQGSHRELLVVLQGAVGLLLVIAMFNVANLQLVRLAGRTREIAVRLALGATRGHLLRQFVLENTILSVLGGAGGVATAVLGVRFLVSGAVKIIPRAAETKLDGTVLAFACALSVITGLLIGLLTMWHTNRMPAGDLKQGAAGLRGMGPQSHGMRHLLTGAQVALSVVLLVAAALLMRSFFLLSHTDLGLEPRRALAISLGGSSASEREDLLQRLRAMPGVTAAAATDVKPFSGMNMVTGPIQIVGFTRPPDSNPFDYLAATPRVTPEYFSTLGMRMISGRGLAMGDDRAVVVNQAFVRRFARDVEPLGKMLKANKDLRGPIVGVVSDARAIDPRQPAWPTIYSAAGNSGWTGETHLIVRSEEDNLQVLAGFARATIRGYSSRLPILSIAPMEGLVGDSEAADRLNTLVYGTFAMQALMLCLLGTYGVTSYSVSLRAKEFGVRMALGARRREVAWLPLRQMFPFVAGGVVAGLLGALALGRFLESQLFEVKPTDTSTYVGVTVLFVIATAVACWIPARRAARADPLQTLRCE